MVSATVAIALCLLSDPGRIVEIESFDGPTIKPYLAVGDLYNGSEWLAIDASQYITIADSNLQIGEYESQGGFSRAIFVDRKYTFSTMNLVAETKFVINDPCGDQAYSGIVFAGDPFGRTYYEFEITSEESGVTQFGIRRYIPGASLSYLLGINQYINRGAANTLTVGFNSGAPFFDRNEQTMLPGWNFFINGNRLNSIVTFPEDNCELDPFTGELLYPDECQLDSEDLLFDIPLLEGYIGFVKYDPCRGDDHTLSHTSFDYLSFEFDAPPDTGEGGGSVDTPVLFLRGDSNNDGVIDVSDCVHALRFMFAAGPPPVCADAIDVNDNEDVDISDAILIVFFLFGQANIPQPRIGGAGIDLTFGRLSCQ